MVWLSFLFIWRYKMATKKYDDDQIVQMDETPTPFDAQRKRTIAPRGSKSVNSANTGHSKDRFTTVLSIVKKGEMLDPYILFGKLRKRPQKKSAQTHTIYQ